MKVWARIMRAHRIERDLVRAFEMERPTDVDGWNRVLDALCRPLDLARPVVLDKHVRELAHFGRTAFLPGDFMESVSFDRFEVELFPEKKKTSDARRP